MITYILLSSTLTLNFVFLSLDKIHVYLFGHCVWSHPILSFLSVVISSDVQTNWQHISQSKLQLARCVYPSMKLEDVHIVSFQSLGFGYNYNTIQLIKTNRTKMKKRKKEKRKNTGCLQILCGPYPLIIWVSFSEFNC